MDDTNVRDIKVRLEPQGKELRVRGPKRVAHLLRGLNISPGTVLVIRESALLTEDETVGSGEEIEIRSVISGGTREVP